MPGATRRAGAVTGPPSPEAWVAVASIIMDHEYFKWSPIGTAAAATRRRPRIWGPGSPRPKLRLGGLGLHWHMGCEVRSISY